MTAEHPPRKRDERDHRLEQLLECIDSACAHLEVDDEGDRCAKQALWGAKRWAMRLREEEVAAAVGGVRED